MLTKHPEYQMRLTNFIERARRLFPQREVVSIEADGEIVRYTYLDEYRRVYQLANALKDLGIKRGDVVGTFAWNTHRHGELYFAVPTISDVLLDRLLLPFRCCSGNVWLIRAFKGKPLGKSQ